MNGNIIVREDAEELTNARKSSYIREQALKCIPSCFENIRKATKEMKYHARVHIENVEFIPDIIDELAKVLKTAGYITATIGGRGNSMFLYFFWRELTDEEKKKYKSC